MSSGSPFHHCETAVQDRLGISQQYRQKVSRFIRDEMPEQHQTFFANLPFVLIAALDEQGYPWLTPVFGKPGFIEVASASTFSIHSAPTLSSAVQLQLNPADKIGILGIELETRRRNRLNGTVSQNQNGILDIQVDQSFGNCPKYIQKRSLRWEKTPSSPVISSHEGLPVEWHKFIQQTDSFYIASRVSAITDERNSGLDASHRGGKPGFLKIDGNTLTFPDFSGNNFFNTIGNIQSDPRVGLFIPDFNNGDAYFLIGNASIDWSEKKLEEYSGAQRFISIQIERCILSRSGLPIRAQSMELSPALVGTGDWVSPNAKILPEMVYRDWFQQGFEFARQQTNASKQKG